VSKGLTHPSASQMGLTFLAWSAAAAVAGMVLSLIGGE
jgi:hypothetical protein